MRKVSVLSSNTDFFACLCRKIGSTDCAPLNGYYFIPVYENGDYVLKVTFNFKKCFHKMMLISKVMGSEKESVRLFQEPRRNAHFCHH